jgi:hypothetical protein
MLLHIHLQFFGLGLSINQGTSGFLVNHWKPRELGVASANRHS